MALNLYFHFHTSSPRARSVARSLSDALDGKGRIVVEDPRRADIIVSIGGDGTLLYALRKWRHLGIPFLGINAGNLGFLQEAGESRLEMAVERLAAGRYDLSPYPLLEAVLVDGAGNERGIAGEAFNEVILERETTRTLRLTIEIESHRLGPVIGDGIIVAAPAGSTAYTLSAGGAVVHPGAAVLQITALNAHPSRLAGVVPNPIIVPDTMAVGLIPDWERHRNIRLVIDGETHPLPPHHGITVRKGSGRVELVTLGLQSFWSKLESKFI